MHFEKKILLVAVRLADDDDEINSRESADESYYSNDDNDDDDTSSSGDSDDSEYLDSEDFDDEGDDDEDDGTLYHVDVIRGFDSEIDCDEYCADSEYFILRISPFLQRSTCIALLREIMHRRPMTMTELERFACQAQQQLDQASRECRYALSQSLSRHRAMVNARNERNLREIARDDGRDNRDENDIAEMTDHGVESRRNNRNNANNDCCKRRSDCRDRR